MEKDAEIMAVDMAAWVRAAIEHAEIKTYSMLADALSRARIGSYDKSTIQKMVSGKRKVRLDEAVAISRFTGYDLPRVTGSSEFFQRIEGLSDSDREMMQALLDRIAPGPSLEAE